MESLNLTSTIGENAASVSLCNLTTAAEGYLKAANNLRAESLKYLKSNRQNLSSSGAAAPTQIKDQKLIRQVPGIKNVSPEHS